MKLHIKHLVAILVFIIFTLACAILGCFFATHARADDTISSGLTLVVPSQGSRGWATTFKNSFATPISGHDHTGSGKGLQISTNALATNAVTDTKIRLTNNSYLRARNAANSADLDILKADASNILRFNASVIGANTRSDLGLGSIATQAASSVAITGGSITGITDLAVADGGTGASSAAAARSNLSAAASGANGDITSLTSLARGTWTPSVTLDAGTASNVTCLNCEHMRFGNLAYIHGTVQFDIAGGTPTKVSLGSPPYSGSAHNAATKYPAICEAPTVQSCYWRYGAGDVFEITLFSGTFSTGTSRRVHFQGFYLLA